ncbi:hypothetical protein H1C71_032051 [Ictidomys tridecemlineatus]|nr:hypothetical protein H1C71_032051 [Ictidomys tridecemlineatus]
MGALHRLECSTMSHIPSSFFVLFLRQGFDKWPRLSSNFQSSYFNLLSNWDNRSVCHHALVRNPFFFFFVPGIELRGTQSWSHIPALFCILLRDRVSLCCLVLRFC